MKIFISQPMRGKTDEQIKEERNAACLRIKNLFGEEVEVIDSFFEGVYHEEKPLFYLGKSLELLSQADLVYFVKGWNNSRGCKIEQRCSDEYGYVQYYE